MIQSKSIIRKANFWKQNCKVKVNKVSKSQTWLKLNVCDATNVFTELKIVKQVFQFKKIIIKECLICIVRFDGFLVSKKRTQDFLERECCDWSKFAKINHYRLS